MNGRGWVDGEGCMLERGCIDGVLQKRVIKNRKRQLVIEYQKGREC